MIIAKISPKISIRKAVKKLMNSAYRYGIFEVGMPFKLTLKNMSSYLLHDENKELGLLLNNISMLDRENNSVLFKNSKALAQSIENKIIIKLIQPKDYKYVSWLRMVKKYILIISPAYVMIPINENINVNSIESCNLIIQELNSILHTLAYNVEIILYQREEPLSSLAYIIQSTPFPTRVSLNINLDSMEKEYYTLRDILNDIDRFNIQNKISMISTNKYSLDNKKFREFLDKLPEDIIVCGENI